MKRKSILLASACAICYVLSYLTLSVEGAYTPGSITMGGYDVDWVWAPRFLPGNPTSTSSIREVWWGIYGPLLLLDVFCWHNDESGPGARWVRESPDPGGVVLVRTMYGDAL